MISVARDPVRWAFVVTAALLVVAACGGSVTSFKGTRKLGLSTALTGQSALYGQAISQSMKLALDDINANGGVSGYKIEPDIVDDATDVNRAVDNTGQLIRQDHVVGLLGPVTSAQCQATSPVARQNRVLLIAATCNSYQLTTQPDLINPYYVSVVPNTYMEGTAAGAVAGKLGVKRVFIVAPRYLFGISETNAFVAALKRAAPDAQIANDPSTWYVPFPTNATWGPTLNAIQAAKPDLVYSNIFAADQVNFVKQALQVAPDFFEKHPMTTLSSFDEPNALGSEYPLGVHLYMRAPFLGLSNSRMDDFVRRYRARYNEYPSDSATMAFDATMMWARAAQDAGSFDADQVIKKIVGHSFPSLRGSSFTVRAGDQQANVGETIGTTADSAGKYPFPMLKEVTNLKGDDLIMPPTLMAELRDGRCEKAGDPTTTDFTLCPSWK